MFRRTVSEIMLASLLISIFSLAISIKPAKGEWTGTVYIRADGSIDPPGAPIQQDGNVYTLIGNITGSADAIVIERDNILIEGAGFALHGNGAYASSGINLTRRTNVTIENILIEGFYYGVYLFISDNNTILENNIINNYYGINLICSDYNTISWNILVNNGLFVCCSFDNLVNNNLVNNKPLIYLEGVSDFNVQDAGQVILIECDNISVENLNLSYTSVGVQMLRTNNSNIIGNNMIEDQYGVYLEYSFNNVISTNNILSALSGVHLEDSSHNNVVSNNIKAKVKEYSMYGIALWVRCNYNFVHKNNVTNYGDGIRLFDSSNNVISGNNATSNDVSGICVDTRSHDNYISENDVLANYFGFDLWQCWNNTIYGNNIKKNQNGVIIGYSNGNEFSHNNFVENAHQIYSYSPHNNIWDDGYPSGGNYWSDYEGVDYYSGPYQNITGSDGIGDIPYVIDANNIDHYPLMSPWTLTPSYYNLAITTTVGGTTDPSPGTYSYMAGTVVNVAALSNVGYSFDYWLLDGEVRTENPITIIMNRNHVLGAYFINNIPPIISDPWQDPPVDNVQPFQDVTVWVNVTDYGTGVKNVTLWYSLDNGATWTILNMTALPIPSGITVTYQAIIPGGEADTWVTYKIVAFDNAGNKAVKDKNGFYYKYYVVPEFPSTIILSLIMVLTAIATIIAKKRLPKQPHSN